AVHEHVAVVGIQQPDHVLDADGLPGARRTEDHRDLVVRDAHVEAAQDLVAPERLVHLDELDRVLLAVRPLAARVPLVLVALALALAVVLAIARGRRLVLDGRGGGAALLAVRSLLAGGLLVGALLQLLATDGLLGALLLLVALLRGLLTTVAIEQTHCASTSDRCPGVGPPEELGAEH